MTAEEILKSSEKSALGNSQIVSHVTGKVPNMKKVKKAGSLGAMGFITILLAGFAVFFSSGNLVPSAVSERLIEETDVQYADAVESKKLVFQQALFEGDLPENTVTLLKQNGVDVGYLENEEFIEARQHDGELVLKMGDKIITAGDFINEVSTNANLYNAFNNATYSRAAYYYDDSAKKVFKRIGTSRNNYTSESDFDEVMESMVGNGSKMDVNNVTAVKREKEENGETKVYYVYEETGERVKSNTEAEAFVYGVGSKNTASSSNEATLNSADELKVADTISKEQRSSLFFLAFMENISKMKAGDGNESKINEAMDYLTTKKESEIVDVKTGKIIKTSGTALESPSLYAILSGSTIDTAAVENYSSDRILKTIQNKLNIDNSKAAISGTVASSDKNIKGSAGRFIDSGETVASTETLSVVNKTIDSSLINNSYKTINGIDAGEFLVEGAVNVGKELAKASGGAAGDADAAKDYARLTSSILAMDAKVDKMNRSPFDITSKNTFLGSIIYKLAISSAGFANSFVAPVYADSTNGYLTEFGDCETYSMIGAVGSPQCAEVTTFDTSTLNDTFNDQGFIDFVNKNTSLSSTGKRTINKNSVLADYILYNDERTTPLGVTDGGILSSLWNGSNSVSFTSDIKSMIEKFLGTSDNNRRVANGAAFVNSKNNPSWQTYKYAQRYVSLARATESLRQYAGDSTAYNEIKFFEGDQNPVIAFLEEYYAMNY